MELKESKLEMDDSVSKGILASGKDIQENSVPCTSNFEDHSFDNGEDHTEDHCGGGKKVVEDDEVDILNCMGFNEIEASGCIDGSDEFSSSFSGTVSEHETETALNDQEADSMICADTSLPFWLRKKKLTDHWKKFIQPIMWRCKWIELKIKEFQNQAQKYDKEVEESCQHKQLELENFKSEELGIKSLPYLPSHTQKNRLRKRKKRKRIEETSDVAHYALNHNLFSYHECRKSFADIALNDNSRNLDKRNKSAKDEPVFCEEPLEFREGDAFLEQILLKIEAAKSETCNLKNRVDKVLSENPSRLSLNLPRSADVFTSSEKQKTQLVIKNEDDKSVKSGSVSSLKDNETTDVLLSEIQASRQREGKAIGTTVEQGLSRTARKRTPRNGEVLKEESNVKRQRVSREKPKSNVMMASRFNLPNRKIKRGKRRSGSSGLRRRP